MSALATRRSLFAGAAILAASPATANVRVPSLRSRWVQTQVMLEEFDRKEYEDDAALDADSDRLWALEREILEAPITSAEDALVIALLAGRYLAAGGLSSELDERAVKRVAAWARSH